jgi:hypothetical protein
MSQDVRGVSPSILPFAIPRTAKESLPIVESLVLKLRPLANKDPTVQRWLQATEHNRQALAALASAAAPGFHALLSADAACVTPHIGG